MHRLLSKATILLVKYVLLSEVMPTTPPSQVRQQVLVEERLSHEREVDKHIQEFRVESIQFRNSFDNEGPLVPGLVPSDAVSRLGQYLH